MSIYGRFDKGNKSGVARVKQIPGANFYKEQIGQWTYWRVRLGKKFTGDKAIVRRFAGYSKALEWVEGLAEEKEKHGSEVFALTHDQLTEARATFDRLAEYNVSLTAVVDHWIKFQAPLEVQKTFSELEEEFITSRKNIGCKQSTLTQYRSYMKVICEEFGATKAAVSHLKIGSNPLPELDPALIEQLKGTVPEPLFEKLQAAFRLNQERLARLERENRLLRELRRLDLLEKYGPASEGLSDAQLELLELEPGVSSAEVEAESQREQLELPLKKARKHPGRQEPPAELPRVEQIVACTAQQCVCGQCGQETVVIGYESAEQLDVEPAKYFVRVTKREKRARKACEEQGVQCAPLPARIIEKGLASDRVVIDTIVSKYADYVPFYAGSGIKRMMIAIFTHDHLGQ